MTRTLSARTYGFYFYALVGQVRTEITGSMGNRSPAEADRDKIYSLPPVGNLLVVWLTISRQSVLVADALTARSARSSM